MKLRVPISHNGIIFDEIEFRVDIVRNEWSSDSITRFFSRPSDACSAFIIESHKNEHVELNCKLSGVDEEMSEVYGIDIVAFRNITFTSGVDYITLGQHYCSHDGEVIVDFELLPFIRDIIS